MRATIINSPNYVEVIYNDTIAELKATHELSGGLFPPIYKEIDSVDANYRKSTVERFNLSLDGTYIEIHFISGFKLQTSHHVFEDYKNDLDNTNLYSYIKTILN